MAKINYTYEAKGYVFGNLWGGGKGYYPANTYSNSSLAQLKKEIKKDFKSGALDSGMGYESLIGALMWIKTIATKKTGNTIWTNRDKVETFKLGKIDEGDLYDSYGGDL